MTHKFRNLSSYIIANLRILVVAILIVGFWNCSNLRSQNIPISERTLYHDVSMVSDIVYSKDTTISGKDVSLALDIFYPRNAPRVERPLMILAHGVDLWVVASVT